MECITATPPDHLSFLEGMARDSAICMPGTCCSNLSCWLPSHLVSWRQTGPFCNRRLHFRIFRSSLGLVGVDQLPRFHEKRDLKRVGTTCLMQTLYSRRSWPIFLSLVEVQSSDIREVRHLSHSHSPTCKDSLMFSSLMRRQGAAIWSTWGSVCDERHP